jgi:hypothetical protein
LPLVTPVSTLRGDQNERSRQDQPRADDLARADGQAEPGRRGEHRQRLDPEDGAVDDGDGQVPATMPCDPSRAMTTVALA